MTWICWNDKVVLKCVFLTIMSIRWVYIGLIGGMANGGLLKRLNHFFSARLDLDDSSSTLCKSCIVLRKQCVMKKHANGCDFWQAVLNSTECIYSVSRDA